MAVERWFNAAGHLAAPVDPPLRPDTREPFGLDDFARVLPAAAGAQELSADPWLCVPGEVLQVLRRWRPTPLVRAAAMEAALGTPARIYRKDESAAPTGSHHLTTAVAQAFYAKVDGGSRLVTGSETGRWGSAVAMAAGLFSLDATVYTGESVSKEERSTIEGWGATVVGSRVTPVEDALGDVAARPDSRFATGSVFNHVVVHQSLIGLEAQEQLVQAGEARPDVVVGYCGGGTCLGGAAMAFVGDDNVRLVAVESSSWPVLTAGRFGYIPSDSAGRLPLLAMYSLAPDTVPPAALAPDIRSQAIAPVVCHLIRSGRMEAVAHPLEGVRDAGVQWARAEGVAPSLSAAHSVRAVIDEALLAREEGVERVILFPW